MNTELHNKYKQILLAYKNGELGQTVMPEDSSPTFLDNEQEARLAYFTLPMALNYQRDSYKLWEAALKTYNDPETCFVFDVEKVSKASEEQIRSALMRYKVALQPNKHIATWRTISKTIFDNFGSVEKFIAKSNGDFVQLKNLSLLIIKKDFPIYRDQRFLITGRLL